MRGYVFAIYLNMHNYIIMCMLSKQSDLVRIIFSSLIYSKLDSLVNIIQNKIYRPINWSNDYYNN